jgi:hypothetical protein
MPFAVGIVLVGLLAISTLIGSVESAFVETLESHQRLDAKSQQAKALKAASRKRKGGPRPRAHPCAGRSVQREHSAYNGIHYVRH